MILEEINNREKNFYSIKIDNNLLLIFSLSFSDHSEFYKNILDEYSIFFFKLKLKKLFLFPATLSTVQSDLTESMNKREWEFVSLYVILLWRITSNIKK